MVTWQISKLFIFLLALHSTILIDVIRKETGDEEPFFRCDQGTFIVRDDATHSFYCAKSLTEAGCNLQFISSTNVGFIKTNRAYTTSFGITSSTGSLCPSNHIPYVGDLFIQDYPSNLFKPIWTDTTGIQKVNDTLTFVYVNNNLIKLEVSTTDWPGVLLKVFINCVDTLNGLYLTDASQRCILVKYEGQVIFPLTPQTFDPDATTISLTDSPTVIPANGAYRSDDNDSMIFVVIAVCGCLFFVLTIFTTVAVICSRKKRKRRRVLEDGEAPQPMPTNIQETIKPNKITKLTQTKPRSKLRLGRKKKSREQQLVIAPSVRADPRNQTDSNHDHQRTDYLEEFGDIYIGEIDNNKLNENNKKDLNKKQKSYVRNLKRKSKLKSFKNINFEKEEEPQQHLPHSPIQEDLRPKLISHDNEMDIYEPTDLSSLNDEIDYTRPSTSMKDVFPATPVHRPKPTSTISKIKLGSINGSVRSISGSVPSQRSLNTPTRFQPDESSNRRVTYIDGQNLNEENEQPRKTYTAGHYPDGRLEDPNATSESIEAMFSFSNELIDENDIDESSSSRHNNTTNNKRYETDLETSPNAIHRYNHSTPPKQSINDIATAQQDIDGSSVYLEDDYNIRAYDNSHIKQQQQQHYVEDLDTIANAFPEDIEEYQPNTFQTIKLKNEKKNPLYSQQGNMLMF